MATTYPTGIKILIDGEDCTSALFDSETLELSDSNHEFENIDISAYLRGIGTHTIEVTCEDGVGRVEARVEME